MIWDWHSQENLIALQKKPSFFAQGMRGERLTKLVALGDELSIKGFIFRDL